MEIKQIDSANAHDTKRFFDFPFRLYRNTPQWVPPMASERKSLCCRFYYFLLQERKRAQWVNVNGIGLLPEYRCKLSGVT